MESDSETVFRYAPLSWWVGPDGLSLYRDGVKIATLPAGCFLQIMSEMALALAKRESGK